MARQVLENGVILPAEYSDDWYDDMTSNLTKLDDVIGSDSGKLSSSDVGAAALSNNYNDLDNLPTIPTVNDATLTIQKNGVDVQTFTANASSNVTANITVPTKTSDITNDSNFVDTSNSAVASGITSAKVTSYDSHVADTDKHVTTADKNKWNNQTFVFRYSSTALVASSTNSNTLLDNTDNLKVGDKVIDSSGVLFSITAIDTQNSTFTIGTALIDLAQNSDVVHKSGDETIGGKKQLSEITTFAGSYLGNEGSNSARTCTYSYCNRDTKDYSGIYQRRVRQNREQGSMSGSDISQYAFDVLENQVRTNNVLYFVARDFVNDVPQTVYLTSQCTNRTLGSSNYPWSAVYSNAYYYGNVEFSDKFVTTDTNQTIDSEKTFNNVVPINGTYIGNEPSTTYNTVLLLRSRYDKVGKSGWLVSKFRSNSAQGALRGSDTVFLNFDVLENEVRTNGILRFNLSSWSGNTPGRFSLIPSSAIASTLGSANNKWSAINGLEPSALGMPDLNNGIDISSYLTTGNSNNTYTPSVNGWISISIGASNGGLAIFLEQGDMKASFYSVTGKYQDTNISCFACLPVVAGVVVNIGLKGSGNYINSAKFFPCQGNV